MNQMQELDALCKRARETEDPTDEDRRAVLKSIAAHTGLALGAAAALGVENVAASSLTAGTTGTATLAPASAVVKAGSLLKGLAWLAGIGVPVAFTVQAIQIEEPTGPKRAPSGSVAVRSTAAAPPVARAVEVEAPREPRDALTPMPMEERSGATGPVVRPARSKQARTLEEEAAALANIQRALRDGEAEKAIALLDAEERSLQRGILAPERAAARVFALCSAGRAAEAQVLAGRFLADHANSPLADRVREGCRREPLAR